MPFIEVKSSGPEIADGVYPVILSDIKGPKTVTAQRGPKAGQDIELYDWVFIIESGQLENTEIEASTSTASGPRSKMYEYLTALFGGKAPPIGTQLEKGDIVGRSALATIQTDDRGWPRITNLGALPAGYTPGTPVAAAPAPVATETPAAAEPAATATAPATPLREQVAAGTQVNNRPVPF